ncbi:hypothetical protein [Methylobacterium nonmethylotrophicum]|nr:hypothetical protein [Methylobacterium nonmethylotrophicum]
MASGSGSRDDSGGGSVTGIKGLGEAIANAVGHATGWRIRDLPIRIQDLL